MDGPAVLSEAAVQGAAASRSTRPVMTSPPSPGVGGAVHVYSTGFKANTYADIKPAGDGVGTSRGAAAPRKLWHSSPGSSGR